MMSKPITNKASGEFETADTQLPPEIAVQQQLEQQGQEEQTVDNSSTVEQQSEPVYVKESPQAMNFRQLREQKEAIERERNYLLSLVNNQSTPKVTPQSNHEEDYDVNIEPDAIAEGKHLTKIQKELRNVKKQLQSYQQQSETSIVEAKIRAVCPDFERVCSPENISMLRDTDPELAATINSSGDLYNKAVSAYKAIKRYNIGVTDPYLDDKIRAQKNAAKPKPMASISPQQGESPLAAANAFANGLTDDLKKSLYKEMIELRKGY